MELGTIIVTITAAYLLGSIPSAYIAGRIAKGVDIRTVGSRNVGAWNTIQQVGVGAGIGVLVADTLKGALAVLLATWIGESSWVPLFAAVGVVVGHNWPVFLWFRGGKGVAPALGVSLAMFPLLTLLGMGPAFAVVLLARNVVAGAALGFIIINVLMMATRQDWTQIMLCWFLTIVVVATYLGGSWRRTVAALRRGRWQEIFSFE